MPAGPSPFSVELAPAEVRHGGVRFSCKEMFDVAGHPATCGHPRFASSRRQDATSAVITHLRNAGAYLVGKTHQSELAISGVGENPHYPMPVNPRLDGAAPGGSSTGCAVAVATGRVNFSLATDTAGSARIPAACCGVLGVALAGQERWLRDAVTLSPTLDQLGVLAASPDQLRCALGLLRVPLGAPELRHVIVPSTLLTHCDGKTTAAFDAAVELLKGDGLVVTITDTRAFEEVEEVQAERGSLALAEIAASLAGFLEEREDDVSPHILERLEPYRGWSREQVANLRQAVVAPLQRFRSEHPDPLLLPTLPTSAPTLGTDAPLGALARYANLLGESSISVPLAGLGISVMLVGPAPGALAAFAKRCRRVA